MTFSVAQELSDSEQAGLLTHDRALPPREDAFSSPRLNGICPAHQSMTVMAVVPDSHRFPSSSAWAEPKRKHALYSIVALIIAHGRVKVKARSNSASVGGLPRVIMFTDLDPFFHGLPVDQLGEPDHPLIRIECTP